MKKSETVVKKCIIAIVIICAVILAGYGIYHHFNNVPQESEYNKALSDENIEWLRDEVISKGDGNCPITVDFDILSEINDDITAWIYCENTPISYPVLQGIDNGEYIYNRYDKTISTSGSIYLDYKNSADYSDLKSIIYAQNIDGSMFGSLPEYKAQEYYEEHPVIWLVTPDNSYQLEVIAGFETIAESDDYSLISDEQELKNYINEITEKSDFKTDTDISSFKKIITLSTPMNDSENEQKCYIVAAGIKE